MRDEWFIRGDVPMTKSEVRAVSLSKLELGRDSVLWDIGAGTGSVSIEALLCHPVKKACAFERNVKAVELLKKNREKAGVESLILVEGDAPEQLRRIINGGGGIKADVTHAFIGGTSGSMEEILQMLLALNPKIRVVINVIALETLSAVIEILKKQEIEAEIVQLQVSRAVRAGSSHLMRGQNPVYIISFGGKD